MDYNEAEIVESLLDRVKNNDHSSFTFIRSLEEKTAAKQYFNAAIATANHFKTLRDLLVKEYCSQLDKNEADIEALVAARHLNEAVIFYNKEAIITQDSLSEYRAYVFGGHFLDAYLFNNYRSDEDCVDFRKLPWRFF